VNAEPRASEDKYRGEERRRRWPSAWTGDERRAEPLVIVETDQEPDQSPIVVVTVPVADQAANP
jgi:hypothetical protein